MPKALRRALIVTLSIPGLAVLALALTWLILQTDIGSRQGARLLSSLLSSEEQRIEVGSIEHFGFWRVELGALATTDARGTWIEIDRLQIEWSWADLFDLSFRPHTLLVETAHLRRLPASETAGSSAPVTLPLLPVAQVSIKRLEFDAAVLGEPLVARIEGAETSSESGDLILNASIDRLDGAEGTLALHATYRSASQAVLLRARLNEGKGGVLARFLGIPDAPAYRVKLEGEGPSTGWEGKLDVAADGSTLGHGEVGLSFGDAVTIAFDGHVYGLPLLGPDIDRAIGDRAALSFDAAWDLADLVTVRRSQLHAAAFDLDASGRVLLSAKTVNGQVSARTHNLASLPGLEHSGIDGAGEVSFAVASPVLKPAGDLSFRFTEIRHAGYGVRALSGRGRLETLAPLDGPGLEFQARLDGTIEDPEGVPTFIGSAVGDQIAWKFDVGYSPTDGSIKIESFEVRGANAGIEGKGSLPAPYVEARLTTDFVLEDFGSLNEIVGAPLEGRLEGSAEITAGLSDGRVGATLVANGEGISIGTEQGDELLGPTPDLAGRFDIDADGAVSFSALELAGRIGSLRGEGILVGSGDELRAALRLDIYDLATLQGIVGTPLKGAGTVEATFNGTRDSLSAIGMIAGSGIEAEGVAVERLSATFSVVDLLGMPSGTLKSRFVTQGLEAMVDADLALAQNSTLNIAGLKVIAPDAVLSGDLKVGLDDGLITGKARARLDKLSRWSRFLGIDLSGSTRLEVGLSAEKGRQSAAFDLAGKEIALDLPDGPEMRTRTMAARARIDDVWRKHQGDVAVTFTGAESGSTILSSLILSATGTEENWRMKLHADGNADQPFEFNASAAIAMRSPETTIRLDSLVGRYGKLPIRLREAATMRLTEGGGTLDRLLVVVGKKGTVNLAGGVDSARINATAQARDVPLRLVRAFIPDFEFDGIARFDATVSGDAAHPTGEVTLRIARLRSTRPDTPSGTLEARAVFSDGQTKTELALGGLGGPPIVASFAMPMRLSFHPIAFFVDPAAPIAGHAEGEIDLSLVAPLLPLGEDRLEGRVRVEALLKGTLAQPEASGRAHLTNGRYENFMTSASLDKINFEVVGDHDTLVVRSLSARGPDGGQVIGSGQVRLDAKQDFPLSLSLEFKELWVARLDEIASRASGKLGLSGSIKELTLTGTIEAGPAEIRIPERLPPSITPLEVVEINRPGGPVLAAVQPDAGPGPDRKRPKPMTLDVALKIPGRVFVRGRGLDSEWNGAINLRGDTENPRFDGAFRVVRGNFDLLAKRFVLRESTITLDEAAPLDPEINVLAEATSKEIVAQARLRGSIASPELTLSSIPELPPDEILSRVLFNKGVGQLSAVEAVQLAESAATLSGQSSSLGIMDRLRRTAGFDTLNVGASDTGASVSAGKYVQEDVLLKVEQGTGPGSSRVGVEIEVTPNVSVETSTGISGQSDVGVNWKWDY